MASADSSMPAGIHPADPGPGVTIPTTPLPHALVAAERLQTLAVALCEAATVAEVGEAALREGVVALGAFAGVLAVEDPDAREIVLSNAIGYGPEACMAAGRRWSLDAPMPIAETVRTGTAVFLGSPEEWTARYGRHDPASQSRAWAALPLQLRSGARAGLLWCFDRPVTFAAQGRALIEAVARLCGQALDRARLFDLEHAARAEAEAANETKGRFLAMMSHELRTPLNAIAGYADLLEMGVYGPLDDQQRDAVQRIRRSGRHLLALINDAIGFAKLQAGALEFRAETVPIAPVLDELEAISRPLFASLDISLAIDGREDAPAARGDPDKIRQIGSKLLSNAAKFTPSGGHVRIGARRNGDCVELVVSDTGRGVEPARAESIFEPFVFDREYAGVRTGAGLSLALSRGFARGMGGELRVESRPGHGATFVLSLPAA